MWTMGVPGDDRGKSRRFGIEIEVGEIVKHENLQATDLDDLGQRQRACPRAGVDVASHGERRRDISEPSEDLRIADVAGVDDELRSVKRGHGLGPKQAVCVGDDADPQTTSPARCSPAPGSESR